MKLKGKNLILLCSSLAIIPFVAIQTISCADYSYKFSGLYGYNDELGFEFVGDGQYDGARISGFTYKGNNSIIIPDKITSDSEEERYVKLKGKTFPVYAIGRFFTFTYENQNNEYYVKIPDTIKEIGIGAFSRMKFSNKYITLPKALQIINIAAFSRTNLKEVVLPEGLIKIGDDAFHDSGLLNLTIPKSVKSIGRYAFQENGIHNEVILPDNCTYYSNSFDEGVVVRGGKLIVE